MRQGKAGPRQVPRTARALEECPRPGFGEAGTVAEQWGPEQPSGGGGQRGLTRVRLPGSPASEATSITWIAWQQGSVMGLEGVVAPADSCLSVSSVAEDRVGGPGHCSGAWRPATPSAPPREKDLGLQSQPLAALPTGTLCPQDKVKPSNLPRALHTWEP